MMDTYSFGRFALGAVWVFCLLALTLWWFKKKKGLPFSKVQNKLIQVLEVYPMGIKSRMMLLEVDDQRILVSVNAQDVKTLHTWSTRKNQSTGKAPEGDPRSNHPGHSNLSSYSSHSSDPNFQDPESLMPNHSTVEGTRT